MFTQKQKIGKKIKDNIHGGTQSGEIFHINSLQISYQISKITFAGKGTRKRLKDQK